MFIKFAMNSKMVYFHPQNEKLEGNIDRNSYKINNISIDTKAIRIYPLQWFGHPSMRVGVIGQLKPIQNEIKIAKFSSNGYYATDKTCKPQGAILNGKQTWCAAQQKASQYYLQTDFDNIYKVTNISTQGRHYICKRVIVSKNTNSYQSRVRGSAISSKVFSK